MATAEEEFVRSLEFAIASIKLAIESLDSRIERLETAHLKAHPASWLPSIPPTPQQEEFFERYADLIVEED